MKSLSISLFAFIFLLSACSKKGDTPARDENIFKATINGKAHVFNVVASTLLRSAAFQAKRMDITGISEDGSVRLILTLAEETDQGNGMAVKTYQLDPDADDTEGFTSYSTSLGNDSWSSLIYGETGTLTITACDVDKKSISGTFETILTGVSNESNVIRITDGKMTNLKYNVLN